MPIRGTTSPGLLTGIALLAALALAIAVAPNRAAAAEGEPAFCESRTLHDYLTPLKRMPKLRELPYRARSDLSFHGVSVGSAGPSLVVNGGRAGYQLSWEKNPGWDLTVTFAQVRSNGAILRWIGARHLRLGALAPIRIVEPSFGMSGGPGFYRATLTIHTRSGRKLARFGNYYRVIRPTIDARMVAAAAAYRPGETLFARVENPGASYVSFGGEYDVEGLQGETWGPVPEVPGPIEAPRHLVAPGTTGGRCLAFPIPSSMPAGRYRLAQEAVSSWPLATRFFASMLYAEFEIPAPTP